MPLDDNAFNVPWPKIWVLEVPSASVTYCGCSQGSKFMMRCLFVIMEWEAPESISMVVCVVDGAVILLDTTTI